MRKLLAIFVTFAVCCSLVPTPALAELVDELDVAMQEEMVGDSAAEGDEPAAAAPAAVDEPAAPAADDVSAASADPIDEPAAPEPAADDDEDATLQTQDGDEGGESTTPQFHIQTAQVQGNNATTLASGPNYKHVPTTYYYQLDKDYPVPYRYDGWPLNYTNYFQSSGIYFPGDKIVILAATDSNPNDRTHGQPGICFQDGKGGYYDYDVGTRVGPLLVSGAVTVGNWHPHTYVTELTVVDGPVMFSTASGNSGGSGWADSGPDENGSATDIWPVSSIRYIELPKYHPIEYHYRCGSQEIPAEEVAKATYYNNKPANPQVVWAEDLSTCWLPYVTYGTQWDSYQAGNVFTISRPYIEGYHYEGMEIYMDGNLPGRFNAWAMESGNDEQTYTTRFRFNGDWDFNWTFTNQKEGNESDPIIIHVKYRRMSDTVSTVTEDANGGTINGRSEWMFNFKCTDQNGYFSEYDPQDHLPTRDGYVFDGWYADAACTQVISPSAQNVKDLSGQHNMYESDVRSYVRSYARQQFQDNGANHIRMYAKWSPEGAKAIANLNVTVPQQTFTGSALTPKPVITDGDKTLVEGTDYRVLSYENNVNATSYSSSAKMVIQGIGANYRGVITQGFAIAPKPVTFDFCLEYTTTEYDDTLKKPAVKGFTCSEPGLTYNSTDFSTTYANNRYANSSGKPRVTVTARGNYTGSASKEFTITRRKATPTIKLGYNRTTYTGEECTVPVTVEVDGKALGSYSYDATFSNNVEVGTATVTVTLKDNYEGTGKATFQIVAPTKTLSVAVDASDYTGDKRVYNDWYKYPDLIVKSGSTALAYGTDYYPSFSNNRDAGTAYATVVGVGAYAGYTGQTTFVIEPYDFSDVILQGRLGEYRYTGKAVTPKPYYTEYNYNSGFYVRLEDGVSYTATYKNNVNVGEATITLTGKGNYKGSVSATFAIVQNDAPRTSVSAATVSGLGDWSYTGAEIRPNPSVIVDGTYLTRGRDYELSYKNNVLPGQATITITGINDYMDSKSVTFGITGTVPASNLSKASIAAIGAKTYTGKAIEPGVTVTYAGRTLTKNTDYTVAYSNNVKAGTAKVTVTGKGAYTGTKSATFTIARAKVAVPKAKTGLTYTGKAQVGVAAGTGYTLGGTAKATAAGSYKATATPDANHMWSDGTTAKKTLSWSIAAKKVTPTVTLAKASYVYDAKVHKPAVTVKIGSTKLAASGYTVTYASGLKAVGTYKVTVKLKGNYAGSKAVNFTIVPKATSITKLTAASKALTATWAKRVTQTTGYQIQYATNAKFTSAKTATVSTTGTTSKKLVKLAGKKRYYVRVRTYRKVGSKTYYSAWSAAKNVVTKA